MVPAPKKPTKSFAALVRKHVESAAPSYVFIETSGGSGPIVTFERRSSRHPRLREQVAFQKGLSGADWFRVNLFPSFLAAGAGGKEFEHTLSEGKATGPDVRWSNTAELEAALEKECLMLEAAASAFFAPFEQAYAGYEALFGQLVRHYADWLEATGSTLASHDFAVSDDGKSPAFDAWKTSLEKKELLSGLPGDLETALWRFWNGGRPMRQEEYQQDDYYDCTKCKAFISFARGRLVKGEDPLVGEYFEFVCKKH